MRQEYLVKLGSVYITDSGLVGGTKYISDIEGLNLLSTEYVENETLDMRGNPIVLITNVGQRGKRIEIKLLGCEFSLLEDLIAVREAQKAAEASVQLLLTHPTSSFFSYDLQVNILPITWGRMMTDQFRDVVIRLTTTG